MAGPELEQQDFGPDRGAQGSLDGVPVLSLLVWHTFESSPQARGGGAARFSARNTQPKQIYSRRSPSVRPVSSFVVVVL